MVYSGPVGPTTWHAHHAFQIVRGLDAPIGLRGRGDASAEVCTAAVIPSDAEHSIEAGTLSSVLVYVDPETLPGRCLRRTTESATDAAAWRDRGRPLVRAIQRAPSCWEEAESLRDDAFASLLGEECRPIPLHPALARARRWLSSQLDGGDVSLARVAVEVGISQGRLSHLFGREIGLGLRPFVLWLRLQRAAVELAGGHSLSTAAAAAGFADGAHLSRTFRRMFGIVPSDVAGVASFLLPRGYLPSK